MAKASIDRKTLQFLKNLRKNNNRDWFQTNKDKFTTAQDNVKDFIAALEGEMNKHDQIAGSKVFRIYRDVRFSKDKTPYKSNFGTAIKRASKKLRGGYYLNIEPGNTYVAGGFWGPESKDLKRIRDEFAMDDKPIRKIIKSAGFKKNFGELIGEGVKSAPKGFSRDHQAIDLIRMKQFIVQKNFTEKEVLSPNFLTEVNKAFKAMRPYFNYMSEVLTTDINGAPLD